MTKRSMRCGSRVLQATLTAASLYLLATPALAITKWEQFSQAGEKAYSARDYPEAEKNFQAALKEAEKLEKPDKRVATTVYNLALIYQAQGKFPQAVDQYDKAMDLIKTVYGPVHDRVAQVYLDLGDLYRTQMEDSADDAAKKDLRDKASENYKKAIEVFEETLKKVKAGEGAKCPEGVEPIKMSTTDLASNLAKVLNTFADMFANDEEYAKAEPYYLKAIEVEEADIGQTCAAVGHDKAHLAELYCVQGKYSEAEPLFKESLTITEKETGQDSLQTANVLYNFGGLYYDQGNFSQAEQMFSRSIKIFDKSTAQNPSDIAMKSIAMADCMDRQGKNDQAHGVYKKSIATIEKGNDTAMLINALKQYRNHLLLTNNRDEASKVAARIKELKAKKSSEESKSE